MHLVFYSGDTLSSIMRILVVSYQTWVQNIIDEFRWYFISNVQESPAANNIPSDYGNSMNQRWPKLALRKFCRTGRTKLIASCLKSFALGPSGAKVQNYNFKYEFYRVESIKLILLNAHMKSVFKVKMLLFVVHSVTFRNNTLE